MEITQQQANILLPLLKQISDGGSVTLVQDIGKTTPTSSVSPRSSLSSTPSSSRSSSLSSGVSSGSFSVDYSTDASESSCKHSCDKLFEKKERNMKSPSAHSYCHVSLIKLNYEPCLFGG